MTDEQKNAEAVKQLTSLRYWADILIEEIQQHEALDLDAPELLVSKAQEAAHALKVAYDLDR